MSKNAGYTEYKVTDFEDGISLRDHFAGLAMQGRLASFGDHIEVDDISLVQFAYRVADAMLKGREKGE